MAKGLFAMTPMSWTPAAQLATENLSGSSRSLAAMDKKISQTQTTEYSSPQSNIFGDILPVAGAAVGAAFGPGGMMIGSALGGAAGTMAGGYNAATLGGLGASMAGFMGDKMGLAAMKDGKTDWWGWRFMS